MTKREAKRDACKIVALLIDNYFSVGQPLEECATNNPRHPPGAEECDDCRKQYAALSELKDELERRSDGWKPVSWQRSAHP